MNPQFLIVPLYIFASMALISIFVLGKTESDRAVAIGAIGQLVRLLILATIVMGINPEKLSIVVENIGKLFSSLS